MRRTPRTNAAKFAVSGAEVVDVAFARQLELELIAMNSLRSQAQLLLDIEIGEHDKALQRLTDACSKVAVKTRHLSTIAEDCDAWLNSESDEPSVEFIKAVRDYARKAVQQ